MSPELLQIVIETAGAMRDIARDKRRSAQVRVQAADTLVGLLHDISDMQHNTNERIMADKLDEMHGDHDHGDGAWRG